MKQRVLTSVVLIAIMLLLAIFSGYIVYPIGLAAFAVISLFEILRVVGVDKKPPLAIPAYLLAAAFPISAYFVGRDNSAYFLLILAAGMFVYMLWLMGVSVFSRGKIPFMRISEVFTVTVYVTVSYTSLALLRYQDRDYGIFTVVLAFLIPWICDSFAYICGRLFGKHKLIPEVSPKKTVEGAIGGSIFSVLACLVYGLGIDFIFNEARVDYLVLLILGAVLSVVSQLGDLTASLIKREYGAKDYGTIFPGHGGIMDRFDSVLAVSTILLILTLIFPPFTFA